MRNLNIYLESAVCIGKLPCEISTVSRSRRENGTGSDKFRYCSSIPNRMRLPQNRSQLRFKLLPDMVRHRKTVRMRLRITIITQFSLPMKREIIAEQLLQLCSHRSMGVLEEH